jgi:DNA replication and repair protein RecF
MLHDNILLENIHIKNFRCFEDINLTFDNATVLIQGCNGSGKTSLLEALHYACYLRSFRTHSPKEMLQFEQSNFFIKIGFRNQSFAHEIQAGFSNAKRLIKIDSKAVSSYKELMHYYRVISLTEDDMFLIKGGPQDRRTFIDQLLLLHNPSFIDDLHTLRTIVNNRTSLLHKGYHNNDMFHIWSEQLWDISCIIQQKRENALRAIEAETNNLLQTFFDEGLSVSLTYKHKNMGQEKNFNQFLTENASIFAQERHMGRSLFGAHLDDFEINFQGHRSKSFASRGQQKLIIVLIKIAQIKQLTQHMGPSVFLLDDFMADFDKNRIEHLVTVLGTLDTQRIFTSPSQGELADVLKGLDSLQQIKLTL